MDVTIITQLIGSLGFPIVCCGALFWRMLKADEQHRQEMEKMSDAVNNNTTALTRLVDKLEESEVGKNERNSNQSP